MKHYAITISDPRGAWHFHIGKDAMRWIRIGAVGALCAVVVSIAMNIAQYNLVHGRLSQYFDTNAELVAELAEYNRSFSEIDRVLSGVELLNGVAGDEDDLQKRIHTIALFFNEREQTYAEISSRVMQIENLVGESGEGDGFEAMQRRSELAALNASRRKILHDGIPNGYPTTSQKVTSAFGNRIHPVTKKKHFHKGIDLRAKKRAPVYTTADGVVREAGYSKNAGNYVFVQHNFGFETRYMHLHKNETKTGEVVHKGDLIGLSGNTGRHSTGPHLHYEVRYLGKAFNPIDFLEWEFGSDNIFTQVEDIKWPSLVSLINKQIIRQTLLLSQLAPSFPESWK